VLGFRGIRSIRFISLFNIFSEEEILLFVKDGLMGTIQGSILKLEVLRDFIVIHSLEKFLFKQGFL
jgi:hypothetical protein